jgi:hypothetical protein
MADLQTFTYALTLAYGLGIVLGVFLYVLFEAVDYFKEH